MVILGDNMDYCVFDCGDDDLEKCQEQFYNTKRDDLSELIETIVSCQASLSQRRDDRSLTPPPVSKDLPSPAHVPKITLRPTHSLSSSSQPVRPTSTSSPVLGVPTSKGFVMLNPKNISGLPSGTPVKLFLPSSSNSVVSSGNATVGIQSLRTRPSGFQFRQPIRTTLPHTQPLNSNQTFSQSAERKMVVPSNFKMCTSTSMQSQLNPALTSLPLTRVNPPLLQPIGTLTKMPGTPLAVSTHPTSISVTTVSHQGNKVTLNRGPITFTTNSVQLSASPLIKPSPTNNSPLGYHVGVSPAFCQTPQSTPISQPPMNTLNLQSTLHHLPSNASMPAGPRLAQGTFNIKPPIVKIPPPVLNVKRGPPWLSGNTDVSTAQSVVQSSNSDNPNSSSLVDLTNEDISTKTISPNTQDRAPQEAVQKPKNSGIIKEKTFPSLVVTVRANLKTIPATVINNERLLLDNTMRKVLQMTPPLFTEYLLQQKLLRPEQLCKTHFKNLKLGMYSDSARFPHSGGYVWISECCKSGFCSVFSGSIFDKTLNPPTSVLKLMYHWSCNTAVHNVVQWVKVDNFILKKYYTFFRAICTAAVQEKKGKLGGPRRCVQVGVISLGTSSENKGKKEVKVDILAVMDADNQNIRLKALDNSMPQPNEKLYESKFKRILEVLVEWVDPQSTIIADFAVDVSQCAQHGFVNVVMSGGRNSTYNNSVVMSYLKTWVPKIFQNTLNLLSLQIIQQFLDELVWRETWGPTASRAFDSLVLHLGELTRLPGPDLITKLKKIASYPTKNWKYSVWKDPTIDMVPPELNPSTQPNCVGSPPLLGNPDNITLSSRSSVPRSIRSKPASPPASTPSTPTPPPSTPSTTTSDVKQQSISSDVRSNVRPSVVPTKKWPYSRPSTQTNDRMELLSAGIRSNARSSLPTNTKPTVKPKPKPPGTPAVMNSKNADSNGYWVSALENNHVSPVESSLNSPVIISLEPYYYGSIEGIRRRQKYSGAFLAECALCKKDFDSGITFTNHLIHHALNDSEAWTNLPSDKLACVCKICLATVNDLATHALKKHSKSLTGIITNCKICNVDQKSEERLKNHMENVHYELDMPYNCDECYFRTSIYEDIAYHFRDFHDKDSLIQCPFCLKVVRFCSKRGLEMPHNQHYFVQHIQKHNNPKINRKCEKCMLSFTNMGNLKSHQEQYHCRVSLSVNVRRYFKNPAKFIKMVRPDSDPLPPVTLHESSFHSLKGKVLASSIKIDSSLSNFNCCECDSPIVQNHFSVKMTCTRCSFQSYCANAIKEHSARTHMINADDVSNKFQIIGGSPLLEKPLYCSICAYFTLNANRMATHMANCGDTAVAISVKRKLTCANDIAISLQPRKKRQLRRIDPDRDSLDSNSPNL